MSLIRRSFRFMRETLTSSSQSTATSWMSLLTSWRSTRSSQHIWRGFMVQHFHWILINWIILLLFMLLQYFFPLFLTVTTRQDYCHPKEKLTTWTLHYKVELVATNSYVNISLFLSCRNDHRPLHWQIQVQRPECENKGVLIAGDTW